MSAPAAARASAVARPIPIPPPVTRATRSRRSAIGALGRTFYLTDQQQRVLNNIAPAVYRAGLKDIQLRPLIIDLLTTWEDQLAAPSDNLAKRIVRTSMNRSEEHTSELQ